MCAEVVFAHNIDKRIGWYCVCARGYWFRMLEYGYKGKFCGGLARLSRGSAHLPAFPQWRNRYVFEHVLVPQKEHDQGKTQSLQEHVH